MRPANAASAKFAILRAQNDPILAVREAQQEVNMALQSLPLVHPIPLFPDVPGFAYYTAPQWRPGYMTDTARAKDGASRDALDQHFSYFDAQT